MQVSVVDLNRFLSAVNGNPEVLSSKLTVVSTGENCSVLNLETNDLSPFDDNTGDLLKRLEEKLINGKILEAGQQLEGLDVYR